MKHYTILCAMKCYKLVGKNVEECGLEEGATQEHRQVAKTQRYGVLVSTVFLFIDHNHFNVGPPLVFETMIFGGKHDQYQTRCSTWEDAVKMHQKGVRKTCEL